MAAEAGKEVQGARCKVRGSRIEDRGSSVRGGRKDNSETVNGEAWAIITLLISSRTTLRDGRFRQIKGDR